jgi:hypothetical protein
MMGLDQCQIKELNAYDCNEVPQGAIADVLCTTGANITPKEKKNCGIMIIRRKRAPLQTFASVPNAQSSK